MLVALYNVILIHAIYIIYMYICSRPDKAYSGPCNLRIVYLTILSILRLATSHTTLFAISISIYLKTTFDLRPLFFYLNGSS